jgi:hypothetical protein
MRYLALVCLLTTQAGCSRVFLCPTAVKAPNVRPSTGPVGMSAAPRSIPATTRAVEPVLITWLEYDGYRKNDPDKAIYQINGESLGKGIDGFRAVLLRLESIPEGSAVKITWAPLPQGQGYPPYRPPYDGFEECYKDLLALRDRRHLNITESSDDIPLPKKAPGGDD